MAEVLIIGLPHLFPVQGSWPKLSERAFPHTGRQMIIQIRNLFFHRFDQLFYGLPDGVAVMWAGGRFWLKAMKSDSFAGFLLAEIDEGADHGEPGPVKISNRCKGCELAAVQETHKKSLHGIVIMMCISDFVAAVLVGKAIHGTAPEIGTGEARRLSSLRFNGAGYIDIDSVVRDGKGLAEVTHAICMEFGIGKHGIDRECFELKALVQAFLQNGHGIGQEDAVLPARKADENLVAVFNHLKLDYSSHQLAEIFLRNVDFHKGLRSSLASVFC